MPHSRSITVRVSEFFAKPPPVCWRVVNMESFNAIVELSGNVKVAIMRKIVGNAVEIFHASRHSAGRRAAIVGQIIVVAARCAHVPPSPVT